ncbi:MAG TPA: hypothetical protein VL486_15250 [Verrucomicrobiae bacterium]|nr:hypothetical protein [Verrucomicrobiae bacterium]
MISQKHRKVLRTIYERLMDLDSPWAITGSLGFALHGMDVPVSDIDLQTDREGAYKIQDVFRDHAIKNVAFSEAKAIRSHFGELRILGVKVEIMGAVQKRLPSGEWESPVEVREHRRFVEFDGMKLPVLSLDYEETAYRILGRIDKANMIKQWLTKSPERTTGSDEG